MSNEIQLFCPLQRVTLVARESSQGQTIGSALQILAKQLFSFVSSYSGKQVKSVLIVVLEQDSGYNDVASALKMAKALCTSYGVPSRVLYTSQDWLKDSGVRAS